MKIELLSTEVFFASPQAGTGVFADSYYTQNKGGELLSHIQYISRSDTMDAAFCRRSSDNGRTWSDIEPLPGPQITAGGTLRRFHFPGHVDPATGRLLKVEMRAILPTDTPREGLKLWQLFYTVSQDGGQSTMLDAQAIAEGEEFTAEHPFPGIWLGKNAIQRGATSCLPITLMDGTLLFPCQLSPVDENGELYNPTGGYSYHQSAALRARWREDNSLAWEKSQPVISPPSVSTRGMIEPTIAQLKDGRILMVMRGSNDSNPSLPGYKWSSISSDGGRTWTEPVPWTYEDGTSFYSPSACSQLLRHSSGTLLWLGNISENNPVGNSPRYPLLVGVVDENSGLLIRDSLQIIDDRREGDSERMHLSNFFAREDRETGEIVLHLTRILAKSGETMDWTSDALLYRLKLTES